MKLLANSELGYDVKTCKWHHLFEKIMGYACITTSFFPACSLHQLLSMPKHGIVTVNFNFLAEKFEYVVGFRSTFSLFILSCKRTNKGKKKRIGKKLSLNDFEFTNLFVCLLCLCSTLIVCAFSLWLLQNYCYCSIIPTCSCCETFSVWRTIVF